MSRVEEARARSAEVSAAFERTRDFSTVIRNLYVGLQGLRPTGPVPRVVITVPDESAPWFESTIYDAMQIMSNRTVPPAVDKDGYASVRYYGCIEVRWRPATLDWTVREEAAMSESRVARAILDAIKAEIRAGRAGAMQSVTDAVDADAAILRAGRVQGLSDALAIIERHEKGEQR